MSDKTLVTARAVCALCGRTIADIATEVRGTGIVVNLPIYPCNCLSMLAYQLPDVPAALRCLLMTRSLSEAQMIFRKFGGGSRERTDTTQNEARSELERVPAGNGHYGVTTNSTETGSEVAPAAIKAEVREQRSEVSGDQWVNDHLILYESEPPRWFRVGWRTDLNRSWIEPAEQPDTSAEGCGCAEIITNPRLVRMFCSAHGEIRRIHTDWPFASPPSQLQTENSKLLSEFRAMGMQLHTYHSNVGPQERMKEWANCQYHYCRDRFALAHPNGAAMIVGNEPNHHEGTRGHHER